jgi:hypothetical protein
MDQAYVITGMVERASGMVPVTGVLFSNKRPEYAKLAELGFQDAAIHNANPLTKQPTEPTLYLFASSAHAKQVEIIRLGMDCEVISRVSFHGDPSVIVPPVGGKKASELLYTPRAFLIKGSSILGKPPVMGILVVKPVPKEKPLSPDSKVLKKLGFGPTNLVVEEVGLAPGDITENTLHIVERSPSADTVSVLTLDNEGDETARQEKKGDPKQLLPDVSGPAVDRIFGRSLRPTDMPAPISSAPPKRKKKKRRR